MFPRVVLSSFELGIAAVGCGSGGREVHCYDGLRFRCWTESVPIRRVLVSSQLRMNP